MSVLVPTYNEAENLPLLVRRLADNLEEHLPSYEIVVIDDGSPDGTADVGRSLAASYPVRVIERDGREGLATAVEAGFQAANADRFVVMDADLQHPPERVPDLLAALDEGAQLAIGSRHADGGSMGAFGPLRRLVSYGADTLARTLLPRLRTVEDLQSGFFALERTVIAEADLDPTGYKILLEILVQGDAEDVVEIGYTFGQRERGESKLDASNVVAYLHHLASLVRRQGEHRRIGRFVTVGAAGALVNLALLTLLMHLGTPGLLASALAIEAGLVSNFTLNRAWTFRDRAPQDGRSLLSALGRDHLVRAGGMGINLAVFAALTAIGRPPLASQALGIGLATAWNYAGNTWWTWTPARSPEDGASDEQALPSPGSSDGTPGHGGDFKPGAGRGSDRDGPLARLRERAG